MTEAGASMKNRHVVTFFAAFFRVFRGMPMYYCFPQTPNETLRLKNTRLYIIIKREKIIIKP